MSTQPIHLPETDPEFPNIIKPQEGDRNAFQQATRVGDHERVLAKMEGREDVFAEPAPTDRPTADQMKGIVDSNNVRAEDQAEAEEANRPKEHQEMPEATETTPAGKSVGKQSKMVAKGKATK